jgi:hypothetical protein
MRVMRLRATTSVPQAEAECVRQCDIAPYSVCGHLQGSLSSFNLFHLFDNSCGQNGNPHYGADGRWSSGAQCCL